MHMPYNSSQYPPRRPTPYDRRNNRFTRGPVPRAPRRPNKPNIQNQNKNGVLNQGKGGIIFASLGLVAGLAVFLDGLIDLNSLMLLGSAFIIPSLWYFYCRHIDNQHISEWRKRVEDNNVTRHVLGSMNIAYNPVPTDLTVPEKYRPGKYAILVLAIILAVVSTVF